MRRNVLPLLLAALTVAVPVPRAIAQDTSDSTRAVRASAAIGVHYGTPLRLSLVAGGLFDFRGSRNDGIVLAAEPGQGGVELSMGYFRMRDFGRGYSVRLAGIRTGDEPWNASPHTNYLGAEAHVMVLIGVGGRIGWFRRVGGESMPNVKENVGSLGVSIGI